MKKIALITLLLAAAAGMTWLIWWRPVNEPGEEKKPEAEVPVRTAKVNRTTLRRYVTAYGLVEPAPKASARIAAPVQGIVAAVRCTEGQHVEKGEVLFQLDSRTVDVSAMYAAKSLERQKQLISVEGTSQRNLQDAELALATLKTQQALLRVQAPISGVVTRINVKAGEAADLTTALAELVDLTQTVVSLNIASTDLVEIRVGQSAEVSLTEDAKPITTTIVYTSPNVDPKTGSGVVRATLPADSEFRSGQFVKARIATGERPNCLVVPVSSVAKDATGAAYIALVEGEKAVLKPVKLGLREGDRIEVEADGLEAGQSVVTEGAYGIIMTQQFATKIRVAGE